MVMKLEDSILQNEASNDGSRINLYKEGNKWHAFGLSSFLITCILPSVIIKKIELLESYIKSPMSIICNDELKVLTKDNMIMTTKEEYIQIKTCQKIYSEEDYCQWLKEIID